LTVLYMALTVLYMALTVLYLGLTVLYLALTVLYLSLTVLYVRSLHLAWRSCPLRRQRREARTLPEIEYGTYKTVKARFWPWLSYMCHNLVLTVLYMP